MYLAGREMTDRNLKAKGGFGFGNFAILANRESCNIEVNLIRKFCFQNLRILKKALRNRSRRARHAKRSNFIEIIKIYRND